MKKFNIYFILLACISVFLFTACEDEITREPSPAANPNSANVYFANNNNSSPILGIEESDFTVIVSREKTESAQTVALSVETIYADFFEVPAQVSFAAGEAEVEITVKVKNIELMKKYSLSIFIEHNQTSPYIKQTVYPRIDLTVVKEDFAPYAKGLYSCGLFGMVDVARILEYSPATEIYRLPSLWSESGGVTFYWKEDEVTIIGTNMSTGQVSIPTGYVHPVYGMIHAGYYPDYTYYDEDEETLVFGIEFYDSDGPWGDYMDTFKITETL